MPNDERAEFMEDVRQAAEELRQLANKFDAWDARVNPVGESEVSMVSRRLAAQLDSAAFSAEGFMRLKSAQRV